MGQDPKPSREPAPPIEMQTSQQDAQLELSKSRLGAHKLLSALSTAGLPPEDLFHVSKAIEVMFELHKYQTRSDGAPYVNHTLLVAQVLSRKFGITDPAAVMAALLHDAPEDQTPRISKIFRNGAPITERQAISLLCSHIGVTETKVAQHLLYLTNPDFKSMVLELKTIPHSLELKRSEAYRLFSIVLHETAGNSYTIEAAIRDTPPQEVKNKLYLAHWIEILDGDPITRAIKIADFHTNGLQRHRLYQHLDRLQDGSPEKERTQQFAENLRKKYGPVVKFLKERLTNVVTRGKNLVSPRGDLLIGRQIGRVAPLYLQPYAAPYGKILR